MDRTKWAGSTLTLSSTQHLVIFIWVGLALFKNMDIVCCISPSCLYCFDYHGSNLHWNVDLCFPPSVHAVRTWWRSPWMCLYAGFSLTVTSCGKQGKTTHPSTTPNPHQRLLSFWKKTRPSHQKRIPLKLDLRSPLLLSRRTKGLELHLLLTHLLWHSLAMLLWMWLVDHIRDQ